MVISVKHLCCQFLQRFDLRCPADVFGFPENIQQFERGQAGDVLVIWQPDARQLALMELDWLDVRDKVLRGEAHLISEGDGLILGAATKAADSSKVRSQPFSAEPAKPRAWSLKQSFTRTLYFEIKTKVEYESLMREVASRLTPANHALAVELAALPMRIRGFGHVKERNVTEAKAREASLLAAFRRPVQQRQEEYAG